MRALYTASTGMAAQEMNVEIISNNIANMRTSGFKRQRAEFQDLLYESLRRVGSSSSDTGTVLPTGLVMRAMGKDLLRLKRQPDAESYWIVRAPPGPAPDTMKDQF